MSRSVRYRCFYPLVWFGCALGAEHAQPTETVLHNFVTPPRGDYPMSGVVRDAAGNLYGTTAYGGSANLGLVYKVDPKGHETVLHSFAGGADGANPSGGVIRDPAGNLYGTTEYGGASAVGTIFKLDPSGQKSLLHSFTISDGGYPKESLIRDAAGNLYGTASCCGSGLVFELDAAGNETTLYSFSGGADGGGPAGPLSIDAAGNLYGTASQGGAAGAGVVYKIDASHNETVLYSFTGGADGAAPMGGVIRSARGILYGTTTAGGSIGGGVVFSLDAKGHETVLYDFTAGGVTPLSGVIRDSKGNLYGTTSGGGGANGGITAGVVYKLDRRGRETVLYTFTAGTDGGSPMAGVIRDPSGNLYGTTPFNGAANAGVVYKLDAAGKQTVLCAFAGAHDGAAPSGSVTRDASGNIFGATYSGGKYGQGTLFKVDARGRETVLYTFTGGSGGGNPLGVTRDAAGNLYGTMLSFGPSAFGAVYKVDTQGQETVLHSFDPETDGYSPESGVILDPAGNLYGTTTTGGAFARGVVFKVDTAGNESILYSFAGGSDGSYPRASLFRDDAGNLFGTTYYGGAFGAGIVFRLDPAGKETVLYSFTGGADGGMPFGGVLRDTAGNLYGTASAGGASNEGVVFKLTPNGHESVLYSFSLAGGGYYPQGNLVRDAAGNLYGATLVGGANGSQGAGVIYKLDLSGTETVLYSFTGGADGGYPTAGVFRDAAGNLYGATPQGGTTNGGVIFELTGAAAR